MGIYIDDGNGLWTLNVLSHFNSDGSIERGWYGNKTPEADQKGITIEITGSTLLRLEDAERITRESLRDPLTRQSVLDHLHDPKYRGALIYAAVDDATTNFGDLYTRMNEAKKEWLATAEEAGAPVQHYQPGPIIVPPAPAPVLDPADTDKDGALSKAERKAWGKEHPEDPR